MAVSRTPILGIVLVAAIATAAAAFGILNWQWLREREALQRRGIAAIGQVVEAAISHKACNSSVLVTWTDAYSAKHTKRFVTCFANRSSGQSIGIRYLRNNPETAMIADGEGGLPTGQFRTGMQIGFIVAAIMFGVTVHLWGQRTAESLSLNR